MDICLDSLPGKTSILYVDEVGSSPTQGSCLECGKPTKNPMYCGRSCSAKANNRLYPKRKSDYNTKLKASGKKEPAGICDFCKEQFINTSKTKATDKTRKSKYCSVKCGVDARVDGVIQSWLSGETSGISSIGNVTPAIKNWLRRTRGDACEICGWCEVNPITGKVPIVADHIDGNWKNNRPENLRLICPNHDSLQSTYKALNRKGGREWRRK